MNFPFPVEDLPGFELLDAGGRDLAGGRLSAASLLLLVGAWRLRRVGIELPPCPDVPDPEGAFYELLRGDGQANPHGRYLAFIRRLESLERAAESRARSRGVAVGQGQAGSAGASGRAG